jgi:nicotinate-nucleotide adenylyltransferase
MTAERVGYLGGTFDPPHLGHLILAGEAAFQLKLDRVEWILTPDPPHKQNRPVTPVDSRLEMLNIMLKDYSQFSICRVDLDRDPPHYAVDTVELLKKQNPKQELLYIIGEDSLIDLPEWVKPGLFLSYVDWLAVAPRPEIDSDLPALEQLIPGLSAKIINLSGVMIQISSSVIRERIKNNQPFRYYLQEEIADFIINTGLYRSQVQNS